MNIVKKVGGVVLVVGATSMIPAQLALILLAFCGGLILLVTE